MDAAERAGAVADFLQRSLGVLLIGVSKVECDACGLALHEKPITFGRHSLKLAHNVVAQTFLLLVQ